MANWSTLKAAIAQIIKTNNNQEITGANMQSVLNSIIDNVGENATYAGIATPSTNPGAPDGNVFYFATQAGTYANFGRAKVEDGLTILLWNGSNWSATKIMTISQKMGNGENVAMSKQAVSKEIINLLHISSPWTSNYADYFNPTSAVGEGNATQAWGANFGVRGKINGFFVCGVESYPFYIIKYNTKTKRIINIVSSTFTGDWQLVKAETNVDENDRILIVGNVFYKITAADDSIKNCSLSGVTYNNIDFDSTYNLTTANTIMMALIPIGQAIGLDKPNGLFYTNTDPEAIFEFGAGTKDNEVTITANGNLMLVDSSVPSYITIQQSTLNQDLAGSHRTFYTAICGYYNPTNNTWYDHVKVVCVGGINDSYMEGYIQVPILIWYSKMSGNNPIIMYKIPCFDSIKAKEEPKKLYPFYRNMYPVTDKIGTPLNQALAYGYIVHGREILIKGVRVFCQTSINNGNNPTIEAYYVTLSAVGGVRAEKIKEFSKPALDRGASMQNYKWLDLIFDDKYIIDDLHAICLKGPIRYCGLADGTNIPAGTKLYSGDYCISVNLTNGEVTNITRSTDLFITGYYILDDTNIGTEGSTWISSVPDYLPMQFTAVSTSNEAFAPYMERKFLCYGIKFFPFPQTGLTENANNDSFDVLYVKLAEDSTETYKLIKTLAHFDYQDGVINYPSDGRIIFDEPIIVGEEYQIFLRGRFYYINSLSSDKPCRIVLTARLDKNGGLTGNIVKPKNPGYSNSYAIPIWFMTSMDHTSGEAYNGLLNLIRDTTLEFRGIANPLFMQLFAKEGTVHVTIENKQGTGEATTGDVSIQTSSYILIPKSTNYITTQAKKTFENVYCQFGCIYAVISITDFTFKEFRYSPLAASASVAGGDSISISDKTEAIIPIAFLDNGNVAWTIGNNLSGKANIQLDIQPPYIYSVYNDLNSDRMYGLKMYIDHLFRNRSSISDMVTSDGNNFVNIVSHGNPTGTVNSGTQNQTKDVDEFTVNTVLSGDKWNDYNLSINVRSIRNKAVANKAVRLLCIGDSVTEGYMADYNRPYTNSPTAYWTWLTALFALDKAENNNTGFFFQSLGNVRGSATGCVNIEKLTFDVKFGGREISGLTAHCCGVGGSTTTGWVSPEIKTGITNPFYDPSAQKFSLDYWVNNYRTLTVNSDGSTTVCDDSSKGSLAPADLNSVYVCEPTHVLIQLGYNQRYSAEGTAKTNYIQNLTEMINTIRQEYPNVYILLSLPDTAGTYFPRQFPNYEFDSPLYGLRFTSGTAKVPHDQISYMNQDLLDLCNESNKIFYCPSYFASPLCRGTSYRECNEVADYVESNVFSQIRIHTGGLPYLHPNCAAHANWAQQMYGLIKYTLTL